MKVLMISIDKTLLGQNNLGDTIARHKEYGTHVDRLDIIVFTTEKTEPKKLSDKVTVYPTNSTNKVGYYFDAVKIAEKLFGEHRYDLIVTQDPFVTGKVGVHLKKRFKAKLLVHFHGDFWKNSHWLAENPLNYFFLILSKFVVAKADAVRVVSSGIKQKLINAGIAESKVTVIATPVAIKDYEAIPDQLSVEKPVVLHVSRYDKVKDFKTLANLLTAL